MQARSRGVGALLTGVLLVGSWVGPPTVAAAAAVTGCTAADPAPQVLDATATDVVVRRELDRVPGLQDVRVTMRDACGGGYEYQGCAFDPPRPCVGVDVTMRRTADATSPAARGCGRRLNAFDNAQSSTPHPTTEADVFVADLGERWEVHDDGDGLQPLIKNACAGAWDVTAVVTNSWQDGSSTSRPFTRTRAFSLRRWSNLTTDAAPEPVRAGALVTVRGRLVRADWNVNRNVGYAAQLVQLQRRTTTGTYRTVRTVRTDREGRLRTSLKALSTERCYRWVFAGTSTTAGATGPGDCTPVRS